MKREAVCRCIGPAGNSSLTWAEAAGQKLTHPEKVILVQRSALLAGWVAYKQSAYPAWCRQATEYKGIRACTAALRILPQCPDRLRWVMLFAQRWQGELYLLS